VFEKVLIANRGEIACRAIRTISKLGLKSVAIYASADASSLHVRDADEAIALGGTTARENYLDAEKVLEAARSSGAAAIFPGYGFLSENAEFADRCEAAGVAFIGPTSEQIRAFGLKHRARELALAADVPLLPGTELLTDRDAAIVAAARIGYPVMLKSTAGGGGIGLTLCRDEAQLRDSFDSSVRLSENNFRDGGVFLEKFLARARHIEVQVFGDGLGNVVALGERDCSAQRRNQKVIEETPAAGLTDAVRQGLYAAAVRLTKQLGYRSAGTVEFIYDVDSESYYFLEVNTRLQVEHGVTEEVTGIDLVQWMIDTARGQPPDLTNFVANERGHSIQARVYAEAPAMSFRPCSGLLTHVSFPALGDGLRVDTWVETGVEVSPFYDPMIAKVIATGETREQAARRLVEALNSTRFDGIETNRNYLTDILQSDAFANATLTTQTLASGAVEATGIEVIDAGTFSTIQDYPGRTGYWNVGIPPSGPMDALSLRLGNRVVGNAENAAGLEMTLSGVSLRFWEKQLIALAGADMHAKLNGQAVPRYVPLVVDKGDELTLGKASGGGARAYLCIRNGFDVPAYLGSRATFTLGRFGGHGGRVLQLGDVLRANDRGATDPARALPTPEQPRLGHYWQLRVTYGPHGAPDFFTTGDIALFFDTDWEVHYNSARTGVRLIGPKPKWARPDGGEAGLHPSNIHDNAYAFGTVDYTGDMPIILGPDGPSLGGFVCPATVVEADLWKIGQLAPGDRLRFVPITHTMARRFAGEQDEWVRNFARPVSEMSTAARTSAPLEPPPLPELLPRLLGEARGAVVDTLPASAEGLPKVTYRPAGDAFLLVEYGDMVLDLNLRFRVHTLAEWLVTNAVRGIVETTPGIRSLQIHYDAGLLPLTRLLDLLQRAETELPDTRSLQVPTRVVHLPLSWDDEATQLAIKKYTQLVRKDAPWAPSNIEFIRRINGLQNVEDVKQIVFDASYLVLGLGDVYLGAPVATPLDPRHRLVTTKYNPARTWTPENAVGIGGAYLCIYGMEGPGGYQFVGRTLQVYNRFRVTRDFQADKPWLLRFFDQIRFYPVSGPELLEMRDAFAAGRHSLKIEEQTFDLAEYNQFLADEAESIEAFTTVQRKAFDEERARWVANGQLNFKEHDAAVDPGGDVPDGCIGVPSPVPGSVWKVTVAEGTTVARGDSLIVLESMKMEMAVSAPAAGVVRIVHATEGASVSAGQILVVLEPDGERA